MPSQISSSPVSPGTSSNTRQAATESANIARLLQSLPASVSAGQQLQAKVVAAEHNGKTFDVLLRLALPDGQLSTVSAQSNQPLSSGQNVILTALGQTSVSISAAMEKLAPVLTRLEPAQFPPGTLIQARVSQIETTVQGSFRAHLNLLNTTQAGSQLVIESAKPLPLNSLVSARVDGSFQLQFVPMSQNIDRLHIQQELLGQFSRQGSLTEALALLNSASGKLAPEGQKVIQQLLGSLPDISQKPGSAQLAELVKNSGIQLEQRLTGDATGAAQQDLKAALLRVMGQIMPPQTAAAIQLTSAQAAIASQAMPQLLREMGGLNLQHMRQQAMRFPLTKGVLQKLDNPNDLGALLRIAAAAISRLQTHQLASLGQTYTTPEGTQLTTWQMEVPIRDQDSLVPLQLKFQREQQTEEQEQQEPVWRLELSFELEPLGPLHVQVNLKNEELNSKLWAEYAHTAEFVNQELPVLRDKLLAAGLNINKLECRQGMPPQAPQAAIEQRWIDDIA